ncbi:MAG: hypothetical protein ACTSR4_05325 [Candidatus Hodarchaeales archaeon]
MPNLTTEIVWTLGFELVILILVSYLIFINTRKFFNTDHSRPLLVFLIALIGLFLTSIATIISMFITILTLQQMFFTVITTILGVIILLRDVRVNWLDFEQIYLVEPDSLILFLFVIFSVIIGIFILDDLRNGLKDVWVTQRRQLITMIVSTVIIIVVPLIISVLFALNKVPYSILVELITRIPVIIGFIILSISFGNPSDFSLFYRRKADKMVITNITGTPLFHYDFKENIHYVNETLFSGAIVAITMLMSESIKSSSPIAEVLMKNKYRLMLETKESFIVLILTPRGNSFLRDSLERFATSFDRKFNSIIASGEIVDLNLFISSGLDILFADFGIPMKFLKEIVDRLLFEDTF